MANEKTLGQCPRVFSSCINQYEAYHAYARSVDWNHRCAGIVSGKIKESPPVKRACCGLEPRIIRERETRNPLPRWVTTGRKGAPRVWLNRRRPSKSLRHCRESAHMPPLPRSNARSHLSDRPTDRRKNGQLVPLFYTWRHGAPFLPPSGRSGGRRS